MATGLAAAGKLSGSKASGGSKILVDYLTRTGNSHGLADFVRHAQSRV